MQYVFQLLISLLLFMSPAPQYRHNLLKANNVCHLCTARVKHDIAAIVTIRQ